MRRTEPWAPNARVLLALVALVAGPSLLAAQTPALQAPAPRALTLDEALRLALPASEAVGLARAEIRRLRGEERQARSEFYPQLTGTASYTRTLSSQFDRGSSTPDTTVRNFCNRFTADPTQPVGTRLDSLEAAVECATRLNPFAALGDLPFGQENQYNLGLQASQLLFAGGRVRGRAGAARAGREAAEIALSAQEAQLTLDVTRAYYDAALADRLLAIAQATLALADSTLEETRVGRRVGTQAEFDLLRAQVQRDNQRAQVIQREADRRVAHLRLLQLLNLPLDTRLELTSAVEDSTLVQVATIDSLEAAASPVDVDQRAPVRQAAKAVEAQRALVRVAQAERWPTVTLTSNYARLGYPDDLLPSWGDFVTDWNVALNIRVPLFTGGRIGGSVEAAKANLAAQRLRLAQTRERAALDSEDAAERLRAAKAQWEASQGTVEQAERAYAIAEIRYREGISTQTELGDARLLLEQARANRATAARDLQVARVRMALQAELPLAQ
jgi:outer membrane protein